MRPDRVESFWNDNWEKAWSALGGATTGNPWAAALDHWWRGFATQGDTESQDVLERIVAQSRAFFAFAGPLEKALGGKDWQQDIHSALEALKNQFADPGAGTTALWQAPLEHWRRVGSMLSELPGGYLNSTIPGSGQSAQEFAQGKLQQLLTTPGVGYTREHQEQLQKLARLNIDYQNAYARYARAYTEMAKRSLDELWARIQQRDEPIESVRELYDLWVECSERVYAEEVKTKEYVALHGELVNAAVALRHHTAQIIEETAEAANLPTRREMDTLHARYQQTRRREQRLHAELASARSILAQQRESIGDLQERVDRLHAKLKSVKSKKSKKKPKK